MGFLDRFRKTSTELAPANVGTSWTGTEEWREWDASGNFISGESHYMAALTALAGPPRHEGYLTPVRVTIIREATNTYDSNAFRAEVDGRHVGYLARHISSRVRSMPLAAVASRSAASSVGAQWTPPTSAFTSGSAAGSLQVRKSCSAMWAVLCPGLRTTTRARKPRAIQAVGAQAQG